MTGLPQNDFDHSIIDKTAHRPWPLRDSPWVMTQTWHNLLFAHWPVQVGPMRARVPPDFELDLYEEQAWVGVVPFEMTNVAPRFVPALPRISAFPELNVRTYVRVDEKPGVYFFSLDAANALAVGAARGLLNLPYYTALMHVDTRNASIHYSSRRQASNSAPAEFVATYQSHGTPQHAKRGSLDYFLSERYCLYALDRQSRPYRLEIHHPPWPLQPATAQIQTNTMTDAAGIPLPVIPPHLRFAKRQDVVVWPPEALV